MSTAKYSQKTGGSHNAPALDTLCSFLVLDVLSQQIQSLGRELVNQIIDAVTFDDEPPPVDIAAW